MNEDMRLTTLHVLREMAYPNYMMGDKSAVVDLKDTSLKKCLVLVRNRQAELKTIHDELYEEAKTAQHFLTRLDEKMYRHLIEDVIFSVHHFSEAE